MNDSQTLIAEIDSTLRQFLYVPNEHAYTVMALWAAHTHLRGHDGSFMPQATPRLYFGSKEAGAGKTLALEIVMKMSHNGEIHVNPTSHALTASINQGLGTNGLDELDQYFSGRGTGKNDTRQVILVGYKKGGKISRQVNYEVDWQNVHGPMAMAGKNLNRFQTAEAFETLRTRSIIVALERKPKTIQVDRYRPEMHEPRLNAISRRLSRWGQRNATRINSIDVQDTMDRIGLDNRDEEIWSVLFRLAEFVGGNWPRRIESAARAIVLGQWEDEDEPIQSPAEELLMWIRSIFQDDETFLPTRIILTRIMTEADDSVWFKREWRNPRAAAMGLARTLQTVYGIHADRSTFDGNQERGYFRDDIGVDDTVTDNDIEEIIDAANWDWSVID